MDKTQINLKDPVCTPDYCNSRGNCEIMDIDLICSCEIGYIGNHCQIDKVSYQELETAYEDTFTSVLQSIADTLSQEQIDAFSNLFEGFARFGLNPIFDTTYTSFLTLVFL